jgi:hypothetical protein
MALIQLIDTDKPKPFATQRCKPQPKSKVKNFTAEAARKSGERRGNLINHEGTRLRAQDTKKKQRKSLRKAFTDK